VTVKLRSGQQPGDLRGIEVARRLAFEGAVAGIAIHPRHASQRHRGAPDYALARELVEELPVPVLISGGLQTAEQARSAFEQTGAEAVLLARGSLGNPWVFEQLLGLRSGEPEPEEILAELDWVMGCAVEHLGAERATRFLRKFYPWYLERLGPGYLEALGGIRATQAALQIAPTLEEARATLHGHAVVTAAV
jgi:tRNA-dihydrouridine synthase B